MHVQPSDALPKIMLARYYGPNLPRFLSVDPGADNVLEAPQTSNSYSYVRNSPTNAIDPTGKWLETAFDVAMAGISIKQAWSNPSFGNVAGAVLDVAAVVIPVVPAVGGRAIDAAQAGARVVDAAQAANKVDSAADTARAAGNAGDASGQARFVGDPAGNMVDTTATPQGSYLQPDGSRTDVLQQRGHTIDGQKSHSHTHEAYSNTNPETGETFTGQSRDARPVTGEEAKNIESGKAQRVEKER